MAMELMWLWPVSAWMSPGIAWFVALNVLVGAIAVTSRGQLAGRAASASGRRLCRSASSMVLDRLRSFSMFSAHHAMAEWYHASPEADEQQAAAGAAPEPAVPPESATTASAPVPGAAADAAADEPASLDEGTLLGKQHSARRSSPSWPAAAAATAAAADVEGSGEEPAAAAEITRRRAVARGREAEEVLEEKTQLNARAELFIRQFREELKLQRLNSIINYTRGLRRGAGTASPQ